MTKYNDLIPAESSSLTEKPSEVSDSQVTAWGCTQGQGPGTGGCRGRMPAMMQVLVHIWEKQCRSRFPAPSRF